jgi:hypothetical protein
MTEMGYGQTQADDNYGQDDQCGCRNVDDWSEHSDTGLNVG